MSLQLKDCQTCNGHGFLVRIERYVPALADYDYPYQYILVDAGTEYRPPTDTEAENDCVDLDPIQCRKCGGWGCTK